MSTFERTYLGRVPWGPNIDPFDFTSRLKACNPKTILDIGCGLIHTPLSKSLRSYECDRFVGCDIYEPYIEALSYQKGVFAATEVEFFAEEATEVPARFGDKEFDLVVLLDIVEHIHTENKNQADSKELAKRFLKDVERITNSVLIWIPLGLCPITEDPWGTDNKEGHTHYSTWYAHDLVSLGYGVEIIHSLHTPAIRKHWTRENQWECDGAYAYLDCNKVAE